MNEAEKKLSEFLVSSMASNVDELGYFIQKISTDAYIQGYTDAMESIKKDTEKDSD